MRPRGTYVVMKPDRQTTLLGRSVAQPELFGEFYAAHASAVFVFFARRTLDVEVARDLTAETFAEALASRSRFRGTTEAEAAGWLFGIARHLLSRYLRRGVVERKAVERLGIRMPHLSDDDHERIAELAGLDDLRSGVAAALGELGADQRDAVELRVVAELPYDEVARRLSISEPTARARVSRGLRALADALEPLRPTEVKT